MKPGDAASQRRSAMFENHPGTCLHEISCVTYHDGSFVRHVVSTRRRSPSAVGVYVAHPITGIRVSRIVAMQDLIRSMFDTIGREHGLEVSPFFPMRTTHLGVDDLGANVYGPCEGDFVETRHYTLQNRMDAIVHSDGVLVNYDLATDDGSYRISNGIPFDIGWAAGIAKPTSIVQPDGNPNPRCSLSPGQTRHLDLETGVRVLIEAIASRPREADERVVAEILEFPPERSVDALAMLAQADVRRHRECRAILAVMPGGKSNPSWHGQVGEVADWIVEDVGAARSIVDRLLAVP
jgi:hypothetical protein